MRLTARWLRLLALVATPTSSATILCAEPSTESAAAPPQVHAAEGFAVEMVAAPPLIERPITAAFDDAGYLYVAESSGSNDPVEQQLAERPHRIVRLADRNGDGHYDERTVFADRMMFPEGTMFLDGSLYVSAPPSIWKLTDADGDGVAEKREEWFKGTLTGCANDLHGPYVGPDGWIYWCKGAFAEQTHMVNGREFRSRAAHIWRCRPDGSGLEPVMTGGMDNPVDVVFTPAGERIFSATFLEGDGRRDGLAHAIYGGVYGKNHGVLDGHPRTGELMPALLLMNSAAPSGLERYDSTAFGDEYRDNLFAAQFNTRRVSRHVLQPAGSSFTTVDSDFVWSEHVDFHPTDVLMDADGSLLVIDTGGWYKLCCPTSQLWKPDVLGGIYRVRAISGSSLKDPRGQAIAWDKQTPEQLWTLLGDERSAVRRRAGREFAKRRDTAEFAPFLKSLPQSNRLFGTIGNRGDGQAASLARTWALIQAETPHSRQLVRELLDNVDPRIRQTALHGVSLQRDASAAPQVWARLGDDDPAVRRVAAEASGQLGDAAAIPHLLRAAAAADDRISQHSITYALIELANPAATRDAMAEAGEDGIALALVALDQIPGGGIAAVDVLGHLDAANPRLSDAANWIVGHHPEWGEELTTWLAAKLAATSETAAVAPDQQPKSPAFSHERLETMLAAFAGSPGVQELLASTSADAAQPLAVRQLALRAMAQAPPTMIASWNQALASVISEPNGQLAPLALAAAKRHFPALAHDSPLFRALVAMLANEAADRSLRVSAAALVTANQEALSARDLEFLLSVLKSDAPNADRSAAADALGAARLSAEQLQQLAAAIPTAGPLEINKLVGPFITGGDEPAIALLDALVSAPALPSLRLDLLRSAFDKRGAAVDERLAALEALVNVDAAQQRSRIEELLPAMASGDVRRGHAVFNSAKASCSACHRMGYGGGTTGPELSKIGEVRTERDLLESILFPSLSFVRSYEPMLLLTDDGRAVSGVIRDETETEYVVATGPDEETRLERSLVVEVQPNTVSVMPAGLDKQLTVQELADLVAFLKNAK